MTLLATCYGQVTLCRSRIMTWMCQMGSHFDGPHWTVQVTTANVTFYFHYVSTYHEVKTPILQYRNITHVGIVQFEEKYPHQTTNKHSPCLCHCQYSGPAQSNQPLPPPGISVAGVGRGRCGGVLFKNAYWPRKKRIS
jgi:hypothetical protein